jgi:hypothetical protein
MMRLLQGRLALLGALALTLAVPTNATEQRSPGVMVDVSNRSAASSVPVGSSGLTSQARRSPTPGHRS